MLFVKTNAFFYLYRFDSDTYHLRSAPMHLGISLFTIRRAQRLARSRAASTKHSTLMAGKLLEGEVGLMSGACKIRKMV